jgi:hypothetical protein
MNLEMITTFMARLVIMRIQTNPWTRIETRTRNHSPTPWHTVTNLAPPTRQTISGRAWRGLRPKPTQIPMPRRIFKLRRPAEA